MPQGGEMDAFPVQTLHQPATGGTGQPSWRLDAEGLEDLKNESGLYCTNDPRASIPKAGVGGCQAATTLSPTALPRPFAASILSTGNQEAAHQAMLAIFHFSRLTASKPIQVYHPSANTPNNRRRRTLPTPHFTSFAVGEIVPWRLGIVKTLGVSAYQGQLRAIVYSSSSLFSWPLGSRQPSPATLEDYRALGLGYQHLQWGSCRIVTVAQANATPFNRNLL
ncbi:hypothetical protein BKA70DRAFT_1232231 [Coprinopsis sp. MPI-PUGE-AT-0042]|nr:hypothetical protein BKA70DRAFT_1232231 [Coprinopsis sp. MPI-PUGE-AT-0042]